MNKNKGFTLVELVIVVAIIGIFAGVSKPYFDGMQQKTARANAQSELLKYSSELQKYYALNGSYAHSKLFGSTVTSVSFPELNPTHTITYSLSNNSNTDLKAVGYVLTATPLSTSRSNGDGIICLNHLGQKYWEKGSVGCKLSNTSRWYGD